MAEKIPCSVLILTRNSASSLEQCLRNLGAFGEVLIHDANSEDGTLAIAQKHGAKVLKQYDTDAQSVRITDFTAMRFKQRDEAAYDWVLYLDSDEWLSDELVAEIGEILKTADPKTIVLFPRYPIIEGVLRRYGLYCPEICPRIHHRKSGCTFKTGKTVHEKYVYDDSFTDILTKAHLNVPYAPYEELLRKDDTYIELERRRLRRDGSSWGRYVRWILLREPLVILSILLRMLRIGPKYLRTDATPLRYDLRYVRYHAKLFLATTAAMLRRPLTGGKQRDFTG